MTQDIYFEEYAPGSERTSLGRTISEADIVLHAGHSGDFYPHHMDAEWCKQQPFGQRIAHGTLVFTVSVGLSSGAINPLAISYGYDRVRFVKPVFIGDTIHVRIAVKEKRDHKRSDVGIVSEALNVINQHGETVMVCEHLLLVTRKTNSTSLSV